MTELVIGKPAKVVIKKNQYPAKITAISYNPIQFSKGAGIGGEQRYTVSVDFAADSDAMFIGRKASVIID